MIRVATLLFVLLCTAGTTTLVAQQPIVAPVVEGRIPLPGPRLGPEMRPFEPTFADRRVAARPLLVSGGKDHTFVFSTLALVLIGIIVVLLVV